MLAALRMRVHVESHCLSPQFWSRYDLDFLGQVIKWSAAPEQTPDRIRRAIAAIGVWAESIPPPGGAIKERYQVLANLLAPEPTVSLQGELILLTPEPTVSLQGELIPFILDEKKVELWALRVMPWELLRARRVLSLLTATALQDEQALAAPLSAGESIADRLIAPRRKSRQASAEWLRSTRILDSLSMGLFKNEREEWRLQKPTTLGASQITLALVAWQIEHGALPESLDQLVGPYFAELPQDYYTGEEYRYFGEGVPERLRGGNRTVPPGTPFLWSPGANLLPSPLGGTRDPNAKRTYSVFSRSDSSPPGHAGPPIDEEQAIPFGIILPIPRPEVSSD